jgi:hypothetical protein
MMTSEAIAAVPAAQGTYRSDAVRLLAGFAGLGAAAVNLAVASSLFAAAGPDLPRHGGRRHGRPALGSSPAGVDRCGAEQEPFPDAAGLRSPAARGSGRARGGHCLGAGSGMAGLGISHLAALLLTLMILAATSWLSRRSPNLPGGFGENASGRPGAGTLLAAAFAGALLVAAITTPGLAASTAGQFAVPHGEHAGGHHSP